MIHRHGRGEPRHDYLYLEQRCGVATVMVGVAARSGERAMQSACKDAPILSESHSGASRPTPETGATPFNTLRDPRSGVHHRISPETSVNPHSEPFTDLAPAAPWSGAGPPEALPIFFRGISDAGRRLSPGETADGNRPATCQMLVFSEQGRRCAGRWNTLRNTPLSTRSARTG
ncbi:MAG: hypothetical protein ACRDSJ_16960 [Rubrobacteraceae bacterium]